MITSKTIVLVLSIMMPRDIPDVDHVQKMTSFEECWSAAKEFTERDLTEDMRSHGVLGLKATCAYQEKPSDEN